jgi:uncharacterized protein YvpB
MSKRSSQRTLSWARQDKRPAPLVIWLLLGFVTVIALIGGGLGLWAKGQNEQVKALQAELKVSQHTQQAIHVQLSALQETASTLENRLAALEGEDPAQPLAALGSSTEEMAETAGTPQVDPPAEQQEIVNLQASLSNIQAQLEALTTRLETLESTMVGTVQTLPPEVHLSVARQRQSHNLSCESSAASMAAQYHGIPLGEADVLTALPHDANPYRGFRGNVDGPTGSIDDYGVYAGPVMDVLNEQGLQAQPVNGGLDGIKAAIRRRNPVIAWVTYNCQPSTPTEVTIDGEAVTLVPYQHVVVVTGYDDRPGAGGIWANDPWDGQEDFYSPADFERAMSYFGDMAIEVAAP